MYDKTEVCDQTIAPLVTAVYKAGIAEGVAVLTVTVVAQKTDGDDNYAEQLAVTMCVPDGFRSPQLALLAAIAKGAVSAERVVEGLEMLKRFEAFQSSVFGQIPTAGNA